MLSSKLLNPVITSILRSLYWFKITANTLNTNSSHLLVKSSQPHNLHTCITSYLIPVQPPCTTRYSSVVTLAWQPASSSLHNSWSCAIWHIFVMWFLLSSFFLAYSQPSQIGCLPYFHTWCGLIANLEARSEMCYTRLAENAGRKQNRQKFAICVPSHNFLGYIFDRN